MQKYLPFVLLICLQVVDVVLHLTTGQVEPLRLLSNALIAFDAYHAVFADWYTRMFTYLSGLAYLVLNMVFLFQNGVINPDTGELRLPLFGFVVVSLCLLFLIRPRSQSDASNG